MKKFLDTFRDMSPHDWSLFFLSCGPTFCVAVMVVVVLFA